LSTSPASFYRDRYHKATDQRRFSGQSPGRDRAFDRSRDQNRFRSGYRDRTRSDSRGRDDGNRYYSRNRDNSNRYDARSTSRDRSNYRPYQNTYKPPTNAAAVLNANDHSSVHINKGVCRFCHSDIEHGMKDCYVVKMVENAKQQEN